MSEPSLRDLTGTIRHLDVSRARRLVEAFQRPVVHDGHGIASDADDPVVTGTHGWLKLAAVASHDASADVVGHYQTHLYLHELLRLPLSVARKLARHRGHLYLDKLTAITDAVADGRGRHHGSLMIHVPADLPRSRLEAIVRHQGPLEISGLTSLDERQARVLAA